MKRETVISECENYRYVLWRQWDLINCDYVMFIGLNPSTADAVEDDATIRRCVSFARRWKFGAMCMVNLFAYRARSPLILKKQQDPIGPSNDEWIALCLKEAKRVVVCWGNHGSFTKRFQQVLPLLKKEIYCLGQTQSGQPRHPLYLKSAQKLRRYYPALAGLKK